MHTINKSQLSQFKKNYLNPSQLTLIKKLEQQNGTFNFKYNNKTYIFNFKNSKTQTNFIFNNTKHNTGIMHKGNNIRVQDKYNKINYIENNLINKIDKNN